MSPSARKAIHKREVVYECFARDDGLFEIDAEMRDTKSYDIPKSLGGILKAGEPIHHMRIRVTLDSDLKICDVRTTLDSAPFPQCQATADPMKQLVGFSFGPGWRKRIDGTVGGTLGCTHLRELIFNMATAAFQAIPHYVSNTRLEPVVATDTPPHYVGQCMTWAFEGPAVMQFAPRFYRPPPST